MPRNTGWSQIWGLNFCHNLFYTVKIYLESSLKHPAQESLTLERSFKSFLNVWGFGDKTLKDSRLGKRTMDTKWGIGTEDKQTTPSRKEEFRMG